MDIPYFPIRFYSISNERCLQYHAEIDTDRCFVCKYIHERVIFVIKKIVKLVNMMSYRNLVDTSSVQRGKYVPGTGVNQESINLR